jgi:hypothetical protein
MMGGEVLLVLKEAPTFEGALSIRLVEERDSEGRTKYSIACQKDPPFKGEMGPYTFALAGVSGGLVAEDRDQITKSLEWRREVPLLEAHRILAILENRVASVSPEHVMGLDGTTYDLLIERGFNKVQFTWWCEPPAAWQALGELSKMLLERADAASMIEAQQSDNRKRLIRQLRAKLHEAQTRLNNQLAESIRRHNVRCNELAQSLRVSGVTCPCCNVHSSGVRFVDRSPAAESYFICQACGRSFRPKDF